MTGQVCLTQGNKFFGSNWGMPIVESKIALIALVASAPHPAQMTIVILRVISGAPDPTICTPIVSAKVAFLLQDGGGRLPVIKKKIAIIIPTTNAIQAIWVAAPAIPVKPSTAAIIAMIRNVTAQLIMCFLLIFQESFNQSVSY